jgi:hypothetical protein
VTARAGTPRTKAQAAVRRVLRWAAWISVFHPRSVLVVVALVTGFAFYAALDLKLSTDIVALLPDDVPAAERMRELVEDYGGAEPVVVAVSGQGEEDLGDRIDLTLEIQDRLAERGDVRVVTGVLGGDPFELLQGPQVGSLLLYLEPTDIDALAESLTPEEIDERIAENRRALLSPIAPSTSRLMAEDPLGIITSVLRTRTGLGESLSLTSQDGVLMTRDGSFTLLLVRPEGPAHDFRFAKSMLEGLAQASEDSLAALGMEGTVGRGPKPATAAPGAVHVGITGAPAIIVDYREILARDIRSISGFAFLMVLVLFLLAFRRLGGVIIAGVPLLVGVVWSMGFAALFVGEINVFTAGSVAILCGLAIDFTIHLYNRYLEEAHAHHDMWRSFHAAHGETGVGIAAAAGTTAWAFLATGLSGFRGLRHLGLICSAGIVLTFLASLLLVPALTAVAARLKRDVDRPKGLAGFGLAPMLTVVLRHSKLTVFLGLVGTLLLAWPAFQTRLDEDFRRFRPTAAGSIRLQEAIGEHVNASLSPVLALVDGEDGEELLERSARLEQEFRQLVGPEPLPAAASFGPARVVPPPSEQRRTLERLRELRESGRIEPARVERDLLSALERHGFRIDERARRAAERVRRMLAVDEPLALAEAERGPLAPILEDMLIPRRGGGLEAVVTIYPHRSVSTEGLIDDLQAAVARSGTDAVLAGGRVLSQEVKPLVRRDGARAVIISAIGVITFLMLVLRRPLLVGLTFVPLAVGVVGSIGLMSLFGVDFNLVSVSVVPLIFGIGIDNGIHIVHRFIEHRREDLVEVFRHTGRGIVMTSLTTIVGFGALVFADYPGLVSSGVLAILGVGATLITAVTLLPALLKLLHVKEDRLRNGSPPAPRS